MDGGGIYIALTRIDAEGGIMEGVRRSGTEK
jgi:hypothetical protein